MDLRTEGRRRRRWWSWEDKRTGGGGEDGHGHFGYHMGKKVDKYRVRNANVKHESAIGKPMVEIRPGHVSPGGKTALS